MEQVVDEKEEKKVMSEIMAVVDSQFPKKEEVTTEEVVDTDTTETTPVSDKVDGEEKKEESKQSEPTAVPKEEVKEEELPKGVIKRFGKLTGQVKDLKRIAEEQAAIIEEQKAMLEKLKTKVEPLEVPVEDLVTRETNARIKKYLVEDANKPREKRREMSTEEQEAWAEENFIEYHRWTVKQEIRRENEEREIAAKYNKSGEEKVETKVEQTAVKPDAERQKVYVETVKEYPEFDFVGRSKELEESGLDQDEINKKLYGKGGEFHDFFAYVNEHQELNGDPKAFKQYVKGFLLEKLLREKADSIRKEGAVAERKRISELDEGITSTRGGSSASGTLSKEEREVFELLRKSPEFKDVSEKDYIAAGKRTSSYRR